jgi:hypothetical protein
MMVAMALLAVINILTASNHTGARASRDMSGPSRGS